MEHENKRNSFGGNLSRRHLLQGSASVASLGLIVPGGLAFAATPARGGTLRLSYPNPVDQTDPLLPLSTGGQQLAAAIFDKLTDIGPDGHQVIPRLAISWMSEKHGQEWVFNLRKGVKFHDGRPFTSADVVATAERTLDKARAGRAYGAYGPLKSVHAEGSHKVRFVLTQPFAQLPYTCGGRWGSIVPANRIDTIGSDPIGTGPFKMKDHQPGATTTVMRNDDYWMEGQPYLDEVIFVQLAESVAQQAALRSGSVDIVNQMGVETYLSLRGVPKVRAFSEPTPRHQVMFLSANKTPFTDIRVREAFRYLIDRKGLLAAALLGEGSIGNDVPLLASDPMVPNLEQNDQDLPRAKALLDSAGVKDLSLTLWTSSERPPSPKMALAMQQGASKIGVKIKVNDIPYTQYAAEVSRKEPIYTTQWSGYFTNFERLYRLYHSKGGANYSGVETVPGLDSLLEDIISEVDTAKRKEYLAKALPMIHKGSDRLIPYFQNVFGATTTRVMGYTPPLQGLTDLRALWIQKS
jgi:peptide/nickel transport system substrate-binding protein